MRHADDIAIGQQPTDQSKPAPGGGRPPAEHRKAKGDVYEKRHDLGQKPGIVHGRQRPAVQQCDGAAQQQRIDDMG